MNRFGHILKIISLVMVLSLTIHAETEQETIAKCFVDLKSNDVNVRRRAVLILCKYQSNEVFHNLIPLLDDSDPKVRESVVVGFIEGRVMLRSAALPILRRLHDSNVHTRRMVSSTLLPRIGFYLSGNKAQVEEILAKAIKDKDTIVRKNLINNYYSLRRHLPTAHFFSLLADESSEIRLLSLTKLAQKLSYENLSPYLEKLVVDKDKKIRSQVLKSLGGFGKVGKEYLKIMAQDKDPSIAARAMAYTRNESYLPQIFKILQDSSSPSDLVVDLTQIILDWNEESRAFVGKLLSNADETRRYAALKAMSRTGEDVSQKELLRLVEDDSSRVRKLATALLVRAKLSPEIVSDLAISDYKDVREQALQVAVRGSRQQPEMIDALYDLMLDEEITIRTKALQAIWMCDAEDRYEIFQQSLTDSEPVIRDMAARMLLSSNEPRARKLIDDFRKNNKNVNIQHLQDLNIVTDLKEIAAKQEQGWQLKVKKALYHENFSVQQVAVDVIIQTKDPLLITELKLYLDTRADQKLADYLFKRIAEDEN
ncbi:MAG: hypothetical protein MK132_08290 [Lentisphaerales bacterium]|nr:hypothetical protein [Lentisphaerales bacterium]